VDIFAAEHFPIRLKLIFQRAAGQVENRATSRRPAAAPFSWTLTYAERFMKQVKAARKSATARRSIKQQFIARLRATATFCAIAAEQVIATFAATRSSFGVVD